MGQSRISSQLSQLKQGELVIDRRVGKNSYYGLGESLPANIAEIIALAADELDEIANDNAALQLAINKRSDKARAYFDQLAGKFGRTYLPGRSWKSLSETLLKLMPPAVIADLGAGEGTFSQLLAQRAERVIALDTSEAMVEYGSKVAKENGFTNLEYRHGDIEAPPIDENEVDIAFFSQALHHAQKPQMAIEAAYRILKPGGRIVILDLLKHSVEEARELYADVWLGFSELEISQFLERAGFVSIECDIVDREQEGHGFQTILAIATKR